MSIVLNGTTGITTPDIASTTSTLGALTQALDLGSTGQIQFPATQNASSNANTLDDYEEGTWTVTINDVASTTTGLYVKVGNIVTVHADLTATASANGYYFSLPFASALSHGALVIGWSNAAQAKYIYVNSSTARGILTVSGGTANSNLANGERIIFAGSYIAL